MGVRSMTVRRFEEIQRRLSEGRGLREIARALGVSRGTVRDVRDGVRNSPAAPKAVPDPLWMLQVDWPPIIHDLGLGHPLKFVWEEKAQHLTTYSNFWKQFYRKFPQYRQGSVTAREFAAGERAGDLSQSPTFRQPPSDLLEPPHRHAAYPHIVNSFVWTHEGSRIGFGGRRYRRMAVQIALPMLVKQINENLNIGGPLAPPGASQSAPQVVPN